MFFFLVVLIVLNQLILIFLQGVFLNLLEELLFSQFSTQEWLSSIDCHWPEMFSGDLIQQSLKNELKLWPTHESKDKKSLRKQWRIEPQSCNTKYPAGKLYQIGCWLWFKLAVLAPLNFAPLCRLITTRLFCLLIVPIILHDLHTALSPFFDKISAITCAAMENFCMTRFALS